MTLLATLEQAVGLLVVSASNANNLTANIYAGRSSGSMELPCVVIVAESAEQLIMDTPINRVKLTVQVQERAIDTAVDNSLAQTVYESLDASGIDAKLNTLSSGSLVIYKIDAKNLSNSVGTDDKSWLQECSYEIVSALT